MTGAKEKVRSAVAPQPDVLMTTREEAAALRASARVWSRMNLRMIEFLSFGVMLGVFLSAALHLTVIAETPGDWSLAINCFGALILYALVFLARVRRDFAVRRELLSQQDKMRRELDGRIPSE